LGAIEGSEYKDVTSGKFIPDVPEIKDNHRTYKLTSYIQMLLRQYNELRYISRNAFPSDDLQKFLSTNKITRNEYAALESMPDILPGFFDELAYIRATRASGDLVNFVLESLIGALLDIYDAESKKSDLILSMRRAFVMKFVAQICKNDEMLTKPGQVNWNVFKESTADMRVREGESTEDAAAYDEKDMDDDEGGEREDGEESESLKEEIDFGDTNAAMRNNFDMNVGEDGELDNEMVFADES
jgi:hypothetical protein